MRKNIDINTFISEFRESSIFQHLSYREVEQILSKSHVVSTYEGEYLVHEGDKPNFLFFIIEGALATFQMNDGGEEVAIRLLGKKGCCMDAVIFMGGNSPISVRATVATEVLKIPATALKEMAYVNPKLAGNLLETLANYYGEALTQINNLAIKDAKESVGYYLLKQFIDSNEHIPSFTLKFKKTIVASHLGIKPETLSRTLKWLKKEGSIDIKGEKIILKDEFSLCQYCDELTKKNCATSTSINCKKIK